jgi:aspartyl-tRNA(Asn)/glutamyl-tRNA(Gln) amidotransferase subunit A
MELYQKSLTELIDLINKKEVSSSEVLSSYKKRIDEVDDKVNAIIHKESDLDQELDSKKKGTLKGLPCCIKDNICQKGKLTTCGSKILEGFKASYNATVVEKLKQEDAYILGKTNMDEFAFGSSCETSCYGPTKNPWDLSRIPGGSSGGSAAAVAADEVAFALGSDTGGSIRQPAAMCGVVGLKPTYGRVSRYGLIAFASSLDQIGTFTKTVEDASLIMKIIAGEDRRDSTCSSKELADYTKALEKDIKGVNIGIPEEYFIEGLDKEVEDSVNEAIKVFEKMQANIKKISLPHTKYAVSTYYLIAPAEASSNLARFDGVQYGLRKKADTIEDMYKVTRAEGFGEEAIRRIILGTYSLSSGYYEDYYLKAQKVRTLIQDDFKQAFSEVDCIVAPTSPTPAFKIGEKIDDPLKMYLSDIFTIPANLAGVPAISIPCGFSSNKLPIGLQIIADAFNEEIIFRVAGNYEKETQWHKQKPEI